MNKVKDLEVKLRVIYVDKFESAVPELDTLRHENCSILIAEEKMEEEIQCLGLSDKNQKAKNSKLNSELVKCRTRLIKEKV